MAVTEYLSVSQAAKQKGVSRSAIYLAVRSGKIPHIVIADKIALRPKDVEAYEPIPQDQRKGIRMGGRPRTRSQSDVKRGRGRPRKEETQP